MHISLISDLHNFLIFWILQWRKNYYDTPMVLASFTGCLKTCTWKHFHSTV